MEILNESNFKSCFQDLFLLLKGKDINEYIYLLNKIIKISKEERKDYELLPEEQENIMINQWLVTCRNTISRGKRIIFNSIKSKL